MLHILILAAVTCMVGCLGMPGDSSAQSSLPPVITTQPQPQTSFEGANINLRVSATPSTGVRYYWRFNGLDLPRGFPGQSTPLLSLQNVSQAAAGPYSVVVSNNFGAVTSQTAVVTVNQEFWVAGGYMNMRATPGYSLFVLQMIGNWTNNPTVGGQLLTVQDGCSVFKLDGTGFVANNYLDGWSDPNQLLTSGEGFFFHNPSQETQNITLVGGVVGGRLVNRLPAGLSLCGSFIPQAADLPSLGFYAATGTKAYLYNEVSDSYSLYTVQEGEWFPSAPILDMAEGLFIQSPEGMDWDRTFLLDYLSSGPTYTLVQPLLNSEVSEVNFFTFNYDPSFGRVLDIDGVTPLTNAFVGQLYAGTNAVESSLTPIGEPLPFQNGAGAGYIRGATVKAPRLPTGQAIALQLRVWENCAGNSYEQAILKGSALGRSEVFTTTLHATVENGGPGLAPRNANAFHSFSVSVDQNAPLRVGWVYPHTNGVEICFPTRPGWVYNLEKCGSVNSPVSWRAVTGAEEIIGTGHNAKVFDSTTEQCFYRLRRVR
jgi:hypothetical protein